MENHEGWKPQPRQRAFMARREYEALYGGAAGGGKSDALIIEALRQVNIPHYKGLILRKTFPELRELIDKSLLYYKQAYPAARYNASSHTWTFPSGAKIIFGSMQHTNDRIKYQGQAYDFVAFDELTHFSWDEYSYLFSRNRPNGPGEGVSEARHVMKNPDEKERLKAAELMSKYHNLLTPKVEASDAGGGVIVISPVIDNG